MLKKCLRLATPLVTLWLVAAALLLVSSELFPQAPSRKALQQFDSLASATRAQRVEMIACVPTTGAVIDSLTPATYVAADSATTYGEQDVPPCPPGMTSVHTHPRGTTAPSPLDRRMLERSGAPFALIIAVTPDAWLLVRY